MIKVKNVSKKFGEKVALENINIEFPRFGIVVIYGPSGCGKTTLLNAISGLLDVSGDIEIDSKNITLLSEKEKDEFRIRNVGFIFQDFKLFETESVENNVMFPLETLTFNKKETKQRKCEEFLKIVGLKGKEKQIVNKLSGGEKQRAAIARSLINTPKIILADEPTGALDSKNSLQIMDILSKIATRSLVVIVSHDKELTEKYADQIVEMEDGKVKEIKYIIKHGHEDFLPIEKTFYSNKKPQIPTRFLFNHTLNGIKERKWRTSICNLVTSLGLIGVGLATSLSAAISTNIKDAYSSIIDQSKIIVSLKGDNSIYRQYSGSYYEAYELKEKYPEFIHDIGCNLICDYEAFFKDRNCIALADTSYYTPINGISARHINDFLWLDINYPTIYPNRPSELKDDEVVLGLTIDMIQEICYGLRIERTITSLSNYLLVKPLRMFFDFANYDWQYDDQQIVTVKGFVLTKTPCIYHYNHMWNENMLQTNMRFPSSDSLQTQDYYPWTMKKVYYFQARDNIEKFIEHSMYSDDFDPFILEVANKNYYPWLYANTEISEIRRVLFFSNTLEVIRPKYFDYFQSVDPELERPIYGSYGGYSIYPTSMMMGFSRYMYFSIDEMELDKTIDFNTTINPENNETVILPDSVKVGHFSQSLNGGVNFEIIKEEQVVGMLPTSLNEIVVSKELLKKLTGSEEFPNSPLHIAIVTQERRLNDGSIRKTFEKVVLNITGIIDSQNLSIYHYSHWPITFFQLKCGVSAYELGINTIAMNLQDEIDTEETILKLQRAFPNLNITNPMAEINESVDEVCGYIEIALSLFSLISVIISILILTVCSYLHVLESKKEIGLARCIGINKHESKKFLFSHSILMCLFSFIMASIELFVMNLFICYVIGNEMGSGFTFVFNPLSLIFMFVLAMAISLLSAFINSNKIAKIKPLDALKR